MSKNPINQTEELSHEKSSYESHEIKLINTLAGMIENRLEGTGEHPERASLFVKILINAMLEKGVYTDEMKGWDADRIACASRIYDIGKIAVPDTILMNKGALTQEEVDIMRRHTLAGEEILQKVYDSDGINTPLLTHAKIFVGSHHEYWNGEGHPRGLKGEEIPLQGRIMAVADWYETLVSERPYKKAFTCDEAENIIKNYAGIYFDPLIIAVFDDDSVKKKFAETAAQ
jgi:putative two-component system response regulator